MVDFSRAERARSHRSSFLKASENVISYMEQLQDKYKTTWDENEVVRKERAAIIEETIQLLKSNKIKLGRQLGRCNNNELNEELLTAINSLDDETREKIQINLIRINNRYDKIIRIGQELEDLMETLSHYRVLEDDYRDEVVVTIPKKETLETETQENSTEYPKKDNIIYFKDTEDLEKVIDIKEATPELERSLEENLSELRVNKNNTKDNLVDDENILYFSEEDLFHTVKSTSPQNEVDYITSNELENEIYDDSNDLSEEDEFILFTIDDNLTLKEIAENVYQNENNWIHLYNYRNNTSKIDEAAVLYNVSPETIASNPKYLSGVTLEFPTVLVAKEETNDIPIRKAA